MKFTVTLLAFLATNTMAFDGGVSVIKKQQAYGVAIKADVLRVEHLEGIRNRIYADDTRTVSEVQTETNIAIEPDITVAKRNNISLAVSPLLGFSYKTSEQLHQCKLGVACSTDNGHVPDAVCFNYLTVNEGSLMTGASIKLNIKADEKVQFYIKTGLIGVGNEYKSQSSVGFTVPL